MAEMNALGGTDAPKAEEGVSESTRLELVRKAEQAIAGGDVAYLDQIIFELGAQQGKFQEVDMARTLAESFKTVKVSGDAAKIETAQKTAAEQLAVLAQHAEQAQSTAVAGTTPEQTAASAANTQAQAGAAASADAAIAAAAGPSGSAVAGAEGASAGAAASTEATVTPASDQKDAGEILKKLNLAQKQGGGVGVA